LESRVKKQRYTQGTTKKKGKKYGRISMMDAWHPKAKEMIAPLSLMDYRRKTI
jgi:hypothetical protein